jgi:hypothetical protein
MYIVIEVNVHRSDFDFGQGNDDDGDFWFFYVVVVGCHRRPRRPGVIVDRCGRYEMYRFVDGKRRGGRIIIVNVGS